MKTSVLFLLFALGSFVHAQDKEASSVQEVIIEMFQKVFSEFNANKIQDYFTTDFEFFKDGEIFNSEETVVLIENLGMQYEEEAKNGRILDRKNDFNFLNTIIEENSAFIYYRNSAEFTLDGTIIAQIEWLESAYLIWENQQWKIRFLHSTQIKNNEINR